MSLKSCDNYYNTIKNEITIKIESINMELDNLLYKLHSKVQYEHNKIKRNIVDKLKNDLKTTNNFFEKKADRPKTNNMLELSSYSNSLVLKNSKDSSNKINDQVVFEPIDIEKSFNDMTVPINVTEKPGKL